MKSKIVKRIRKIVAVVAFATTAYTSFAQTPFDSYAPNKKQREMLKLPQATFEAINTDTTAKIKRMEIDVETLVLSYYDKHNNIIGTAQLKPTDFKWWSVDPMANKRESLSPYNFVQNNPINRTDPTGALDGTVIDENGYVVGGKIDGDRGVYQVNGVTQANFNANNMQQYKQQGTRVGETLSEFTFVNPKTGAWLGKVDFTDCAAVNVSNATKALGTFMLTHSTLESFNNYKDNAGNFGTYDIKTNGLIGGRSASSQQKDAYAYEASFYGDGVIMTRRDQGNFFAGRAASMLGLSEATMLSGFGAFQANGNKISGLWNKTVVGVMSVINWLDQKTMGAAISGTPIQGAINIKPVFHDDKVSEDLQRAGYNQFKH